MKTFLVSAASLIAMTFTASAADLPVRTYSKAPLSVPAPVLSWTGGYVGLELGYTSVRGTLGDLDCQYRRQSCPLDNNDDRLPAYERSSAKGFNIGGAIGYDYQVAPSWVLGVVAKVNGVFSEDLRYFGDDSRGEFPLRLADRLNALASFNGRGGFLVTPATLLYITGGYAMAQFQPNHFDSDNRDGTQRIFTGWTLGGGLEQKIAQNASMYLEGKYYSFDSQNWRDGSREPFALNNPHVYTINVGVNYRF